MTFEPENDLERALVLAADDPAHRAAFYRHLLASKIYITQPGSPEGAGSQRVTLSAGAQLRVQTIDIRGQRVIAIYSSVRRLSESLATPSKFIGINALSFMKITRGTPLFLNPGAPYGKELTVSEIDSLIDGTMWQPEKRTIAEHDIQILLGTPNTYPTELVVALARLFATKKAVKRAWLAHVVMPDDVGQGHTLVTLDVDGDLDDVTADAGIVVQNVHVPDPPVDFMRVDTHPIDSYFTRTKPFYRRKIFGVF